MKNSPTIKLVNLSYTHTLLDMSIIAELGTDKGLVESYGSGNNPYNIPMYEEVDPADKKEPEYCKKMAEVGFSLLMRNRTALPVDAYNYVQVLRDYGTGNQPESMYINLFKDGKVDSNAGTGSYDTDGIWTKTKESERQALRNLNTKIVSVANNLKMAMHGVFESTEQDLYISCVDQASAKEEDLRMFGAMFDAKLADFTQQFEQQFGIPLAPNPKLPKDVSIQELEIYKELGGFKSAYAVAGEELMKYTFDISEWDDNIKRKWIDDLFDLNLIVGRCTYDHEKDKEVMEYVDPANFIIQYSNEGSFSDAEYCGYFTLEKISKLDALGFSRDKLIQAAKRWEHHWQNPQGTNWANVVYNDRVADFKVPVFHYNWIDVDVNKNIKVSDQYGRTYVKEVSFDDDTFKKKKKKKNGVKQEEMNSRIRRCYQCSWIIDTDMVYDYGPSPNQARKDKRNPLLNFFVWRGITTNKNMLFGSIVESVIPFLDNLQMSWLKYQDSLSKSHPGGYAINIRLLQNLNIDGQDISPFAAFEMFWRTGKFPYLDVALGESYTGGDVLPIRKIEGNLGELLSVISQEIMFNLQMIERLTGINPIPLGMTPDKDMPVGTTNTAIMGTNNVMRPLINGMFKVKERLGDCALRRAQLHIRNNEKSREAYEMVLGTFNVDLLKEAEHLGVEYGLVPEPRPTDEEKQQLLQVAQAALTPGRDGDTQIDLSQYMYIMEQLKGGANIKKLSRDLAFLIRKNNEEKQRMQQENIQLQADQQRAMKQEEAQSKAQQAQMDLQKELVLTDADTKKEIAVDNNKAKNEAMLKQMEANNDFKKMLYNMKSELLKNGQRTQQ